MNEDYSQFGPLARLIGVWEGDKGMDVAPSADRGISRIPYRERMTLEPMAPIHNHEQTLFGLRYAMTAWPNTGGGPFHEELGYWLWDPKAHQLMRSFLIPRGVTVLAGGTVDPKASSFQIQAEVGSQTYGICSNLFLDHEFRTVRYLFKAKLDETTFTYEQNSVLQMKGRKEPFNHTDGNTLRKVSS